MTDNPNPGVIPDALWWLWEQCASFIPGVRLGGIYANKPGYHNTVAANLNDWPGDYSIRLPIDNQGPPDKARALDLTMDATQMRTRTGYLKAAALHPDDDRLDGLREFYGTTDGRTVYGLMHDGPGQGWYRATSDDSHLWHIHQSWFTKFCNDHAAAAAVGSVLRGQTWEQWQANKGDDMLTAIQTTDVNGDVILMFPWNGTWRRVPRSDNPWILNNSLMALDLAGVARNATTWPGPYDFSDPATWAWTGFEVKPEGAVVFPPEALAAVTAAAEAGAEAGAPTHAEMVAAAQEGAERAEDA